MENSSTYTALDAMIRQGWFLTLLELELNLKALEEKKLITAAEHQILFELAHKTPLVQTVHP